MDTKAECCPKFEAAGWDGAIHEWREKRFVKDRVFTLFYMPMNFGGVMKRLMERVEKTGASVPENLCLSDHTSKWNMDLYLAADREIPGAENVTLSGKFLSKVYEGPYKDTGKWCKDFEDYARERGFSIRRRFMWYTTCPKCAKKYGKNYVVVIGQTE